MFPRSISAGAIGLACAGVALGLSLYVPADAAQPFGTPQDVAFAHRLWKAMEENRLAGPNSIQVRPYKSTSMAHGAVLETMKGQLSVKGRSAEVIVKRNYRPSGIKLQPVFVDPGKYLKSITVMYKREQGYAPDAQNWFFAQFKPNGTLMQHHGMDAAGQVKGCVSCHGKAKSGFVFAIGEKAPRPRPQNQ